MKGMQLNAIKQMELYARYHPETISLSQGIPFLPSDDNIRYDAIAAILNNKVDKYEDPQGLFTLRASISQSLKDEYMDYSEEEILVTAGAMEGISVALLSILTSERSEVIVPTPTYSAYFRAITIARGKAVLLPLEEEKQWELDLSLLQESITSRTAAILLCNPNNPTGSIYTKKVLQEICILAEKYNITLILDEVYKNMIFDNDTFYTPCIEEKFKKQIIRVVSFSKDFSLTGWRVGYLHSSSENIQKIVPVHDALINCVPVISQYVAISALRNQDRILKSNKKTYTKHKKIMKAYLDNLHDFLDYANPMGSYFFFPRFVDEKNSRDFCFNLLEKQKIAVVPGSDFGPGGENHIRLCFGRGEEDIKKGMEGLTNFLVDVR